MISLSKYKTILFLFILAWLTTAQVEAQKYTASNDVMIKTYLQLIKSKSAEELLNEPTPIWHSFLNNKLSEQINEKLTGSLFVKIGSTPSEKLVNEPTLIWHSFLNNKLSEQINKRLENGLFVHDVHTYPPTLLGVSINESSVFTPCE